MGGLPFSEKKWKSECWGEERGKCPNVGRGVKEERREGKDCSMKILYSNFLTFSEKAKEKKIYDCQVL